jgi:ATP-dependent Clp protease ATP-binding subunit ClpA
MFGSFTERAQRVLYLSQEEARKLGHSFVGTEHVLLALTHESQQQPVQETSSPIHRNGAYWPGQHDSPRAA